MPGSPYDCRRLSLSAGASPQVQQVEPYAVHCTFQYGANAGKRNRMREAMIFEDEESYYTGE